MAHWPFKGTPLGALEQYMCSPHSCPLRRGVWDHEQLPVRQLQAGLWWHRQGLPRPRLAGLGLLSLLLFLRPFPSRCSW